MIRPAVKEDYAMIASLWLKTSLQAHSFIPADYWQRMAGSVLRDYLPAAETYVLEDRRQIKGFISILENNYIGALFVLPQFQGQKIGSRLLNYVRRQRPNLSLRVFAKNQSALRFYQGYGFKIVAEYIDESTKEKELLMSWAVGCLSGFHKRFAEDS